MIGYYAHHQGAGHLTRLQSIASHVEEPLWGLSSLERPEGWTGPWTRLARDDEPVPEGDVTAGGVLHWVPETHAGLRRRMWQLADWVEDNHPRLLVVDVSVEVTLFARLMGVSPVVVALPGNRSDPAHRLAYDSAAALLAPWPAGTHELGWPEAWQRKAWTVGGISRYDGRRPLPRPAPGLGGRVLVLWGGGGRSVDAAAVAQAAAATPAWEWVERDPRSAPAADLWKDLAAADVVVTHAGQNAVAEVAAARRPAVMVAQPRPFGEQEATARAVDRLGLAVGLTSWPSADTWPHLLRRAADLGGDRWDLWSSGHGARDAARHLQALSPGDQARSA